MTNFERAIGRMNLRKAMPAAVNIDNSERDELARYANRIDLVIAVFAIGVLFGMAVA